MSFLPSKISLYIHIPFCSKKCSYCDFYSVSTGFETMGKVIDNIILQFKKWTEYLNYPRLETVFIGGGTPSILPNKLLTKLLKEIKSYDSTIKEWTIEANPESITKEFLNICRDNGVNRLSIGVQSFNSQMLKTLGRNCSLEQSLKGLDLIKEKWTGRFSLDLITSIPGQTVDITKKDVDIAASYIPEHISFYSLILEDGTELEDLISKGQINELDDEDSANIWIKGRERLKEKGYINYEVSNYTVREPSFHNISYWELKPYLGLGPGAASTLINRDGEVIRIHNKKSIKEFIKGENSNWGEELEILEPIEFLKDYIMMGLRLREGVNKERFFQIFNSKIEDTIPITNKLIDKSLLEISNTHYLLTDKGYDIMNSVLIDILDSLDNVKVNSVNWFY